MVRVGGGNRRICRAPKCLKWHVDRGYVFASYLIRATCTLMYMHSHAAALAHAPLCGARIASCVSRWAFSDANGEAEELIKGSPRHAQRCGSDPECQRKALLRL